MKIRIGSRESRLAVIQSRLVDPEILSLAPDTAQRIDVGKQARHHPIPQDEINQILLEKALEGKRWCG